MSTDAFLFKAFKFFDLYNNGHLSRSDFFRGIAKCGVVVETHVIILSVRTSTQFTMHIAISKGMSIISSLSKIYCLKNSNWNQKIR